MPSNRLVTLRTENEVLNAWAWCTGKQDADGLRTNRQHRPWTELPLADPTPRTAMSTLVMSPKR